MTSESGENGIDLQLGTAYGPVEPLPTKKKTSFHGDIATDSGRVTVVLKLLKLEDIVREALCWTLARSLGLPTPQAYLVQVDPSVVAGRHIGNPQHLAFGSKETGRGFQRLSENERNALRKWPHVVACAVFDIWIHCTDRYPDNLLIDVNEVFRLIDHEEALPHYANYDTHSSSTLFQTLREGCSKFELYSMRKRAEKFVGECRNVDLVNVKQRILMKYHHDSFSEPISRHIEFLGDRIEVLPGLIAKSIGSTPNPFVLDDDIREGKERYE